MSSLSSLPFHRSVHLVVQTVRGAAALFARVDAAQDLAYAAELGRAPARRDIARLGLDPTGVRAVLRA